MQSGGNLGSRVAENLDALSIKAIRTWIEAPISSCISEWLIAPQNKGGMGIPSWKNRFEKLQVSRRASLLNSPNENIKNLWTDTCLKNIKTDSLILSNPGSVAVTILTKTQNDEAVEHLLGLSYQGRSIKTIVDNLHEGTIDQWSKMTDALPGYLFNFVRKAMQSQLPTLANLHRWGRSPSNLCPLCNNVQSNKHVLSNCSHPDVLQRYTTRHNAILLTLVEWFKTKLNEDFTIFVDLPGTCFRKTADIFISVRPDLVLIKNNKILAIELTICHETNIMSSKEYKLNKYTNLHKYKVAPFQNFDLSLTTCELTVLGFLQFDRKLFANFNIPQFDDQLIKNLSNQVIKYSFDIYARRDVTDI